MIRRVVGHCFPRVSAPLFSRALSTAAASGVTEKTYYDVLGLTRKANDKDVKEAYRRLAKKYHPDRNADDPEAEARFKEVQEAHATLSSRWKRALYDQDIQFGSMATQDADTEKWKENFEKETPEEREARKERYRRYARGEPGEMPELLYHPVAPIVGITLGFPVVFYITMKVPDWLDMHPEESFNDAAVDDRTIPLVWAFHDPIVDKWERLAEGCDAPSPKELYGYYMKSRPELWKDIEAKVLPKVELTVMLKPRTETVQATSRWSTAKVASA